MYKRSRFSRLVIFMLHATFYSEKPETKFLSRMQSATLLVIASVLTLASYSIGAAVQLSCDSQLRLVLPALFTHCSCSYSEWSAWEAVPNSVVRVRTSQCRSNESYNETRTQSAIGQGCQSRTQTRSVCMPDREDRLIMALGLGSTGHDYSSTGFRPRGPAPQRPLGCRTCVTHSYRPAPVPVCLKDSAICHSYVETRGKRSLREERQLHTNQHSSEPHTNPVPLAEDPLPFEWDKHHHRFRRQTGNCETQHILFLLDTSGSIGSSDFMKVKNSVSEFVKLVCRPVKIAVMTFNHNYRIEFCFDCYDNTCHDRINTATKIQNIPYRGGLTHTAGAARCACNVLLGQSCGLDPSANCIDVVFITDGRSNDPTRRICSEVSCLHNRAGVNTYAIGIGNRVLQSELNCITESSNANGIFNFQSVDEFNNAISGIVQRLRDSAVNSALTGSENKYQCLNPDAPTAPTSNACQF